jgi:5-methylcytosine-specific restriction protein A
MPNVIGTAGTELNASYLIDKFQGVSGLILESWGPSARNEDYNDALEIIIERLQCMLVSEIGVNVVSRDLVKLLPDFADRAILIDSASAVRLKGRSAREIRLKIGRAQASLKADPSKLGGNRTKRILLHNTDLTPSDWSSIASSTALQIEAQATIVPEGNQSPKSFTQTTVLIERNAGIRTWVLRTAGGVCELCRLPAPFIDSEGLPFLEVHHVVSLAAGGPDTITNAVALCPNCHRELHHGAEKNLKLEFLYHQIPRLIRATS